MRNFWLTCSTLLVVLCLVALVGSTAKQPAPVSLVPVRSAATGSLAVGSLAVGSLAVGSQAVGSQSAASALVPVDPPTALPAGAVSEGSVDPAQRLSVDVVLRPRHLAVLSNLADQLSAPGGAGGGRLGRGSFAQQFGGSPAAAADLRTLARKAGLSVASTPVDGLFLTVRGTAGQLEHFFHTRLSKVRLADGTTGRRAADPALLPRSVAGSVTSVVGLDDLAQRGPVSLVHRSVVTDTAGALDSPMTTDAGQVAPHACAAAQAEGAGSGIFTDDTLAALYGADGLYQSGADGNGQTIAVYELEPFSPSDIAAFDTCYFGATEATAMSGRLHVIPVDGGQPAGIGVMGEAALDIENVSALAPGAQIDVYEAPNTPAGSLDEFSRIIDDDSASVISTSVGLCEASMQADEPGVQAIENILFEQAAAQGQTVVSAAGDQGSSDCGVMGNRGVAPSLSVDDPASQPFVLGVGGTSVSSGPTPVESVWNDGPLGGGGGGGISKSWEASPWQVDSGVPGFANPTVIAAAENHANSAILFPAGGYLSGGTRRERGGRSGGGAVTVYYNGQWTAFGGTSSAAPLWAAMLIDTESTMACRATQPIGSRLGFAVPLLYAAAGNPATYAASFNDITTGTNSIVAGNAGLYPATVGYDMASGLGTPRFTGPDGAPGLAAALCSLAGDPSPPTVSALDPTAVPVVGGKGRSAPVVTVHGTGFANKSGPLVASVTVGGIRLTPTTGTTIPVQVVNARTLTVKVPSGSRLAPHGTGGSGAGDYQVVVTLIGGASSQPGPRSLLRYVATSGATPLPAVLSVGPTGGPKSGGSVTLHGSGFTGASQVTFGSVPAPTFRVVSDDEMTATAPAESAATHCANPTDPATDVCQVEVVVVGPGGSSAPSTILPPYQGEYAANANGYFPAPAGCDCETVAAATEYDYLAAPVITSVRAKVGADGQQYIGALTPTPVTVNGSGFDILGYLWTNLGTWTNASSSTGPTAPTLTSISPDQLTLSAPFAPAGTIPPLALPVTVQTLASPNIGDLASGTAPSNAAQVVYAPIPTVTGLKGGTRRSAGPITGGTALTVTGVDFGAATSVSVSEQTSTGYAFTTSFTVHGSTLRFLTPPTTVGVYDVEVCSATQCSQPNPAVDTFTYYAPGDPALSSLRPKGGPPGGGTAVILHGTNLGLVRAVRFGSKQATVFSNPAGTDDSGNPSIIDVVAPPGKPGTTVPIRVETLTSVMDGSGYSAPSTAAVFTYAKH